MLHGDHGALSKGVAPQFLSLACFQASDEIDVICLKPFRHTSVGVVEGLVMLLRNRHAVLHERNIWPNVAVHHGVQRKLPQENPPHPLAHDRCCVRQG